MLCLSLGSVSHADLDDDLESPFQFESFDDEEPSEDLEDNADDDDDNDLDDGDDMIEQKVQELFLGTIVYPQERHELQITAGYFQGVEVREDGTHPFEIEYGITDRFQLGVEAPFNQFSDEEDRLEGVEHVSLEAYYNFYNNPRSRTAFGLGYEYGIPVREPDDEPRVHLHEPFFVAYQEFGETAVNFSAGLEIEDSTEETEVEGELALGIFREVGRFVPMLELGLELQEESNPLVLAPGLFWKPRDGCEIGASLPIGLTPSAPDVGVFFLVIFEFGGDDD